MTPPIPKPSPGIVGAFGGLGPAAAADPGGGDLATFFFRTFFLTAIFFAMLQELGAFPTPLELQKSRHNSSFPFYGFELVAFGFLDGLSVFDFEEESFLEESLVDLLADSASFAPFL